jgi:YidC/Oxa1 family membrane protein insertase
VEAAPPAKPLVADVADRDITVATDSVIAVFSTRGAVLKSYRLRHYADAKGDPLELIPANLSAGLYPRPFTIVTDDANETAVLAAALYQPSVDALSLGSEPGVLSFQYRDASGLNATKTFAFRPNGQVYVVNVQAAVDVGGAPRALTIAFGPAIGLGYSPEGATRTPARAIYSLNGEVDRQTAEDVQEQPRFEGTLRFAGVDDHYFLAAALPPPGTSRVEYVAVVEPVPADPLGTVRTFVAFAVRPNLGGPPAASVSMPFFIGPKDFDRLREADGQLVRAIDFGIFSPIVVPLLQALKWVNGYLGNYGWSIVVLTVLINILIFPLRHRSMVSMKKMQALQPDMKAIQERYAKYKVTDPERQKMNSEMMALYKQKGVNPASGCVPMLLTMPILLAFYNLLSQAIELRNAPFFGWIVDLSSKDPYYVWPILMGGSMFWQQRMMPTTADPMQAKIFMFMPIIFTVMFLGMPSGLVIYWLTSNLLTIGQQVLTNRIIGTPAPVRAQGSPRKA